MAIHSRCLVVILLFGLALASAGSQRPYIVTFKQSVTQNQATDHLAWLTQLDSARPNYNVKQARLDATLDWSLNVPWDTFAIGDGLSGYFGQFSEAVAYQIRQHPHVALVEPDGSCKIQSVLKNAPWGLARLSHSEKLDYSTFSKYLYDDSLGENTDIYILDTGVAVSHANFQGRASWSANLVDGDDQDNNGHGTHCAGTAAAMKFGVASNANIKAIKVLDEHGTGSTSIMIQGIEHVVREHLKRSNANDADDSFRGSIVNIPSVCDKSTVLLEAISNATASGIHFAVAAGNENRDACLSSPADSPDAITVAASTLDDTRAYFSNQGKCVDIFAAGFNVQSTWIGSDNAINTISGTSMASAHVAGLQAYLLGLSESSMTPKELKSKIMDVATMGALGDLPDYYSTPNLLAYNGGGGVPDLEMAHHRSAGPEQVVVQGSWKVEV